MLIFCFTVKKKPLTHTLKLGTQNFYAVWKNVVYVFIKIKLVYRGILSTLCMKKPGPKTVSMWSTKNHDYFDVNDKNGKHGLTFARG